MITIQPSLSNVDTLTATELTITGGTKTDTDPALTITQTWNDAADSFIGALTNITLTAAANGAKLQDWQIGGVSLASVGPGANTNGVFRVGTVGASHASIVAFSANTTYPAAATTTIEGFRSAPTVSDTGGSGTFAQVVGFRANNATKSGGADTFTKQVGVQVNNMTSGALNYGFEGLLAVSGSARYNLYMSGTAPNYLAGPTGIGIDQSSSTALHVAAATTALSSIRIPHGTAPSSPVNGDIWTTTAGLYVRVNGSTVGPLS